MDRTPRDCISAGHGLGSRTPGKVDPGNVAGPITEAKFTRILSVNLYNDLRVLYAKHPGAYVYFRDAGPYYSADDEAAARECEVFVELHTDAAASKAARGCTVFYEDPKDAEFAAKVADRLSRALGIPNRGARRRTDLAVLDPKPGMTQVLVEVLFASSPKDNLAWKLRRLIGERALLNCILEFHGWRRVHTLPRTWTAYQVKAYRR